MITEGREIQNPDGNDRDNSGKHQHAEHQPLVHHSEQLTPLTDESEPLGPGRDESGLGCVH